MLAADPAVGAMCRAGGQAVGAERLLSADAPVRRGFDGVPIHRIEISGLGPDVHALVAQVRAVQGCYVPRGQLWMRHGHTTFMPAALRIARLTAVRAICTL